jgi:hypothetical protein
MPNVDPITEIDANEPALADGEDLLVTMRVCYPSSETHEVCSEDVTLLVRAMRNVPTLERVNHDKSSSRVKIIPSTLRYTLGTDGKLVHPVS